MVEQRSRVTRLKSNLRRLKTKAKQEFFVPERLILLITPVLLVAFSIGIISSLGRNWELQQEIAAKKLEEQYLELEIESLELENQYYASEEYQELSARRLLNKKLPGETLVYLPKNSDLAKNKYPPAASSRPTSEPSNFDQWMSYLFGK